MPLCVHLLNNGVEKPPAVAASIGKYLMQSRGDDRGESSARCLAS